MIDGANLSDTSRHPWSWPVRLLVPLAHAAERAGADGEALLAGCGLDPGRLDLDGRVPIEAVHALVDAAVAETGDELLGLHAAQHRSLSDFDAFGFLVTTSSTLRSAVDTCSMFARLIGERFETLEQPGRVILRYARLGPSHAAQRHLIEMIAFDWAMNLGLLVEGGPWVEQVRFKHDPPAWRDALDEAFGGRVAYAAPFDELVLPASAMALPMPDANLHMHAFFQRHARRQLEALPASDDLLTRARSLVEDQLRGGQVGIEMLARRLGLGERTLQRRLERHGLTVRSLIDDVRRARACALISDHSAADLAARLGYSEPAAFHRAFKRWTGMTPEAFRLRAAPGAAGREAADRG